jgi:hypothetical protein
VSPRESWGDSESHPSGSGSACAIPETKKGSDLSVASQGKFTNDGAGGRVRYWLGIYGCPRASDPTGVDSGRPVALSERNRAKN